MTYAARTIKQIPNRDRLEVIDACNDAIKTDRLISIRLDAQDEDTYVYGIYVNDADWVEDYYRSGGVWEYMCPERFLHG